jgi:hypothetical protein
MCHSHVVAVLILSAGCCLAVRARPSTPSAKSPVVTAIERLQAAVPGVQVRMTGERVTRVYGRAVARGGSPDDAAGQLIRQHAPVFGVEPADLLLEGLDPQIGAVQPVMYDPQRRDYKFMLVRYAQFREGVRVFRADLRVLVRNEAGFPAVLAASSLRGLGDFSPTRAPFNAQLDPTQSVDQPFDQFTSPELVIWAGLGSDTVAPCLGYAFVAQRGQATQGGYALWLFVVDAATGGILYKEDQIIRTDVSGNVSGLATTGPKADFCAPEVATAMRYAKVWIGGTPAYADANGDFTIPNPGSGPVTVVSGMSGQYFVVDNLQGDEETLTLIVTPPGPANFLHNSANNTEGIRAQVNGYVQANIVRDFCLTYDPDYPWISGQTDFPVRVMSTNPDWCPGNAWYDGGSINFCAAGGGSADFAFSNIVHHEYGHHIVNCGGSGQGAYGEGMGDSIGVLIADDPGCGYGSNGDCNSVVRTADNDFQYPCDGGGHYCGQLLSGCIWSTRNELANTHPVDYLEVLSNLTINSVLLHDGSEITPDITVDFLTLDDDDTDIYNGTPHCEEICAGFGAHNMGCPPPLDVYCHATWVDFAYSGSENGTFQKPYNTVAEGVSAVPAGGALIIKAGSSSETPTISKGMTIRSYGGAVSIGQ